MREVLGYWFYVLDRASAASFESIGQTPGAILFAVLALALGVGIVYLRQGADHATIRLNLRSALGTVGIAVLAWVPFFLWQVVRTPYVLHREAVARAVAAEQELKAGARRKEIRETLGAFMVRGREIQRRCSDESQPPPSREADAWAQEIEQFFRASLDGSYVARFRSHAGLSPSLTSISSPVHRNVWSFMHIRLARLDQFLQEHAVSR